MEDPNMLAADCIVICCCCECLVLQILLLLLLKLPWKLVRKMIEFSKRRRRLHGEKEARKMVERVMSGYEDELRGISDGRCMRNEGDELGLNSCMEEIEKVMEDLHEKGEFGFGSFGSCRDEEQFSPTKIQYQLIQVISST